MLSILSGDVYAWGMGSSQQLGQRDDDDLWTPEIITGKQLETRSVFPVFVPCLCV